MARLPWLLRRLLTCSKACVQKSVCFLVDVDVCCGFDLNESCIWSVCEVQYIAKTGLLAHGIAVVAILRSRWFLKFSRSKLAIEKRSGRDLEEI